MYTNAIARIHAASQLDWYLVTDIIDFIHKLRDYLLQTPGKLSCTNLPSISPCNSYNLFNRQVRFPENAYYICEGIGLWNDRLQRLKLLTSLVMHHNRVLREYNNIMTTGDAEIALLSVIDEIILAYEAADGFVDRQVFEQRYKLMWEDNDNWEECEGQQGSFSNHQPTEEDQLQSQQEQEQQQQQQRNHHQQKKQQPYHVQPHPVE